MHVENWFFIMVISLGWTASGMFKSWIRHREKMAMTGAGNSDFQDRFSRFERRLANIESIIIERDKKSEFEQSLK